MLEIQLMNLFVEILSITMGINLWFAPGSCDSGDIVGSWWFNMDRGAELTMVDVDKWLKVRVGTLQYSQKISFMVLLPIC